MPENSGPRSIPELLFFMRQKILAYIFYDCFIQFPLFFLLTGLGFPLAQHKSNEDSSKERLPARILYLCHHQKKA